MNEMAVIYLAKAQASLAGAQSEFANGRFDNCANRSYYACFQAAIAALLYAGISPRGSVAQWKHEFVQAQFAGALVNSRKHYDSSLRDTLPRLQIHRLKADYEADTVTQIQASRGFRRATEFVEMINKRLGNSS